VDAPDLLLDAASLEINHARDHCGASAEGQILEAHRP